MGVAETEVASSLLHKSGISKFVDKYLAGPEIGW